MNKSNRYGRLLSNSAVFMVGNLGSKLITFIMLPLYTYTLSTRNFGVTDLVQTTVNLLLPVCFISISDAVLRFSMDKSENNSQILTNGTCVTFLSSIIIVFFTISFSYFKIKYVWYVAIILILQGVQSLFGQFLKAIGLVRIFAFNGILLTFCTALFNCLFLWWLRLGVAGFFFSIIVGLLISNMYLYLRGKVWTFISIQKFSKSKTMEMLGYSVPLIANSIAWWTTSEIDRYYILFMLGTSMNGLFAVANKIPSIISLLSSIFFQSWQLSAIEEYDSASSQSFFSAVFRLYSEVVFIGISSILLFLKLILSILVSPGFYTAWHFVPFLLLSVAYSSFASFLGQNYVAAKKTKNILWTTVWGSGLNLLLSVLLVPWLKLQGICIASMFSFGAVWIYRQFDTKKFVAMTLDLKSMILNHVVIVFQIIGLFYLTGFVLISYQIIMVIVISYIDRDVFKAIFKLKKFPGFKVKVHHQVE